ncbi:MAG: sensor histidine kinase [Nitrospirae bacterium]|nr:MAG: sensor histidine kinase [Nitrospirota bacterium]
MFSIKTSIQNKVRYGYYLCLALIIIVSVLNYLNLRTIRQKIDFSIIISQFFDASLEMRRFEKNFIIYKEKDEYLENVRYTGVAEGILKRNKTAIAKLSPGTDISALEKTIGQYKSLMNRYYSSSIANRQGSRETLTLEAQIRDQGKKLITATEEIAQAERTYIKALILSSKRILLASIVFLIVAGGLIGRYMSRMVVRPLKQVEENMQRIIDGNFDRISLDSSDTEIQSLSNAYTRMLKELESRQMRVILQSEKLACLGTMVSGVAHQLNNPLSNISSSCQILQEEIDEADLVYKKELLQQVEKEVDRAKAMVHSLLEFSRKKEFKSKPLLLHELLADTVRLIQGEIPTKVELKIDIPEHYWIVADKQRIEQAILNILKNSIDAIPDDGEIVISALEDADAREVELRMRDTGLGIEPDIVKKIFEPFFTTKDEGMGSGLGLFVAREIVEEHEGRIAVESSPGVGTTFIIRLPMREALCS